MTESKSNKIVTNNIVNIKNHIGVNLAQLSTGTWDASPEKDSKEKKLTESSLSRILTTKSKITIQILESIVENINKLLKTSENKDFNEIQIDIADLFKEDFYLYAPQSYYLSAFAPYTHLEQKKKITFESTYYFYYFRPEDDTFSPNPADVRYGIISVNSFNLSNDSTYQNKANMFTCRMKWGLKPSEDEVFASSSDSQNSGIVYSTNDNIIFEFKLKDNASPVIMNFHIPDSLKDPYKCGVGTLSYSYGANSSDPCISKVILLNKKIDVSQEGSKKEIQNLLFLGGNNSKDLNNANDDDQQEFKNKVKKILEQTDKSKDLKKLLNDDALSTAIESLGEHFIVKNKFSQISNTNDKTAYQKIKKLWLDSERESDNHGE